MGAGDTFSAGIIKYFEKNKKLNKKNLKFISEQDWLNALIFANSVASKTCERIGCDPPKIKQKYFPNISPEAYWTSKPNFWNRKMYWTVNFMTGHNYSRFFAYQQLPVLFVKDR